MRVRSRGGAGSGASTRVGGLAMFPATGRWDPVDFAAARGPVPLVPGAAAPGRGTSRCAPVLRDVRAAWFAPVLPLLGARGVGTSSPRGARAGAWLAVGGLAD